MLHFTKKKIQKYVLYFTDNCGSDNGVNNGAQNTGDRIGNVNGNANCGDGNGVGNGVNNKGDDIGNVNGNGKPTQSAPVPSSHFITTLKHIGKHSNIESSLKSLRASLGKLFSCLLANVLLPSNIQHFLSDASHKKLKGNVTFTSTCLDVIVALPYFKNIIYKHNAPKVKLLALKYFQYGSCWRLISSSMALPVMCRSNFLSYILM